MSFSSTILDGGNVIESIGDKLENLHISDEDRLEKQLEIAKAERELNNLEAKFFAHLNLAQANTNTAESKSSNVFVAGWRPAIGWIGAIALFYQFIVYQLLLWIPSIAAPPHMASAELYTIITGMLGIAGMRSFDKLKGKDTKEIKI